MGAGGAGMAGADLSDVGTLNPASLNHLRGFFIKSSLYQFELQSSSYNGWGLAFYDATRISSIPAGVHYSQGQFKNPNIREKILGLGLAGFISPQWSWGLAFNYQELEGTNLNSTRHTMSSFDLGLHYAEAPHIGWGLAFLNLGQGKHNMIPAALIRPETLGLGWVYIFEQILRIKIDYQAKEVSKASGTSVVALGLEKNISDFFMFRLGFNSEEGRLGYAAGLSFNGPKFAIHYGFGKKEKAKAFIEETRHQVDFEIPF